MQQILVTTDLSSASRAAVRFAIQLATQMDVKLVFFHCFQSLVPTSIHRERIDQAIREQTEEHREQLERLVADIHISMQVPAGAHELVVLEYGDTDKAILEYAHNQGFQYICMSSRGAGSLEKIMGTHTGYIVQRSFVPVLVIPPGYRVEPIEKILYASDLEHLDAEMTVVSAFSRNLSLRADLVHFYLPGRISLDAATLNQMWSAKYPILDRVYLEEDDLVESFAPQLDRLTDKIKPSLIVFFAHAHTTWFDKLFGPDVAMSISFTTKVPMLVYRKKKE